MKAYINEDEFDALPPETQRQYYFCPDCKKFYLKSKTETCICKYPD